MWYIVILALGLFLGFKLGRKYQDFQDIMLARRVAKLVQQREQVKQHMHEYDDIDVSNDDILKVDFNGKGAKKK